MNIVCNLYSILKMGYVKNFDSVIVWNKNIVRKILYIIWLLGYIRGFSILQNNRILVLLKNESTFRLIQSVSKPGRRIYWGVAYLKHLARYSDRYFIITTSRGILTQEGCLLLHIGGEPLCLLY